MALDKRKNMAKVAREARAGGRMSTKEKNLKEKSAFAYYSQGDKSLTQIGLDLAINPSTVQSWFKKYDWEKRKQKIDDEILKQEAKTIVQFKKQQIKVIMGLMQKVYKDVKDGDKGNSKDYLALQEKFFEMTGIEKEENGFKLIINESGEDASYLLDFIKTTLTKQKHKKFTKDYEQYKKENRINTHKQTEKGTANAEVGLKREGDCERLGGNDIPPLSPKKRKKTEEEQVEELMN